MFTGCVNTKADGTISPSTLKGVPPLFWYTSSQEGYTWVPLLGSCQYRDKESTFTMGGFGLGALGYEERYFDEKGEYAGMYGWDINLLGLWSSFEEETVQNNYTHKAFEKLFLFGLVGYGNEYDIGYMKFLWFIKTPNPASYIEVEYECPTCGATVDENVLNCPECGQQFFPFKGVGSAPSATTSPDDGEKEPGE